MLTTEELDSIERTNDVAQHVTDFFNESHLTPDEAAKVLLLVTLSVSRAVADEQRWFWRAILLTLMCDGFLRQDGMMDGALPGLTTHPAPGATQ